MGDGDGANTGQPKDVRDAAKDVIDHDTKNAPAGRPGKTSATGTRVAMGGRTISKPVVAGAVAAVALVAIGAGVYAATSGGSSKTTNAVATASSSSSSPASSSSTASPVGGGQSSVNVKTMDIRFVQSEFATHYTVNATDTAGLPLRYQWVLEPPANDPNCNNHGNVHSTNSEFVWAHGDQDGCDHTKQGPLGHDGTVDLIVTDGKFACQAEFKGTQGANDAPNASANFEPCARLGTSTASVVILDNEAHLGGIICQGGTITFHWQFRGANPGDPVVVRFSGPGLPAEQTFTIGADGTIDQTFPISGAGNWTTDIVSIAGKPPPNQNTHGDARATC